MSIENVDFLFQGFYYPLLLCVSPLSKIVYYCLGSKIAFSLASETWKTFDGVVNRTCTAEECIISIDFGRLTISGHFGRSF